MIFDTSEAQSLTQLDIGKNIEFLISNKFGSHRSLNEIKTIAIGGLPAVGKTSIIKKILKSAEKITFIQNKDWSKYNRTEKLSLGLTGLEPESYLSNFFSDIESLRKGGTIKIAQYDHQLGRFSGQYKTICPAGCETIILEGCVWLIPPFTDMVDYSVHIIPESRETWETNLTYRDQLERGCSTGQCTVRKKLFWRNYKERIIPNLGHVDVTLIQAGLSSSKKDFFYKTSSTAQMVNILG